MNFWFICIVRSYLKTDNNNYRYNNNEKVDMRMIYGKRNKNVITATEQKPACSPDFKCVKHYLTVTNYRCKFMCYIHKRSINKSFERMHVEHGNQIWNRKSFLQVQYFFPFYISFVRSIHRSIENPTGFTRLVTWINCTISVTTILTVSALITR